MANFTFTTSDRRSEAAPSFPHTTLTQQFTAVMRDLSAYIEAERDLEYCNSCDPACDAWITDAERARTRVLDSLVQLLATPVTRGEELPLRHFGIITRNMIASDNAHDFRKALCLPEQMARLFRSCGDALPARRINLMITSFRQHLADLAALSDFADNTEMVLYTDVIAFETSPMIAPAA